MKPKFFSITLTVIFLIPVICIFYYFVWTPFHKFNYQPLETEITEYYFDFRLDYPEGIPPQGIDIEVRGTETVDLLNTFLSVNDTDIHDTGQPGYYHIDPSMEKNNHLNITIRSFNKIDNSFAHTDSNDIDYYIFTLLPD